MSDDLHNDNSVDDSFEDLFDDLDIADPEPTRYLFERLFHTDQAALKTAALLTEVTGHGPDAAYWRAMAVSPLAAVLRASGWYEHPDYGLTWGGGMTWALRAWSEIGEPSSDDSYDLDAPSWHAVDKTNHEGISQ